MSECAEVLCELMCELEEAKMTLFGMNTAANENLKLISN